MAYEYRFSGTLPEDSSTYIKRPADDELYNSLKAGKFCYVLNSRKMGKSSLRVQVMRRLQQDGIICIIIDLSLFNTSFSTPEQWYADIIDNLVQRADLDFDLDAWWDEQKNISPIRIFSKFIEKVLLQQVHQNIVIFIDEIDSILSLKFPCDDFFAFIRGCYNLRADNPIYNRLTFCLLGVATPGDLIADIKRTPFNIGQAIELTPFSLEEITSSSLIQGFLEKVENPKAVLEQIWYWTNGQPFLTQKLCNLIVNHISDNTRILLEGRVSTIIHNQIIYNWEYQDEPEHLRTIRDRILKDERSASRLLGIYQSILQNGEVATNQSPEQVELCLSGLVIKQNGSLKIYNRIYKSIFNLSWVDKQLATLRPYSESFNRWLASGYKDESRLLQGKALQDAINWSSNKKLNFVDYQFLNASQKYQNQKEAEKNAKEVLLQANKQANRRIRIGAIFLLFAIMTAGLFANSAEKNRKKILAISNIQFSGNVALQLSSYQQIEALKSAIKLGDKLQKLVNNSHSVENYPVSSPILALQSILDNIQERNQFKHEENKGQVNSVSVSPNGKYIVTASTDTTAQLWDRNGKQLAPLPHKEKEGVVFRANFSSDSKYIVTASADTTAKVWDLSGNEIAILKHDKNYKVSRAIFSPDGKRIVTVSFDKKYDYKSTYKITFWHSQNYEKIASLAFQQKKDQQFKVIDAVFTIHGLVIVTTSEQGIVQLFNEQGKLTQTLIGHEEEVKSADFRKDGQLIATASKDNTVRLWEWNPNQKLQDNLVQVLREHTSVVNGVVFSHNGQYVATASRDNTVRLWKKDENQNLYAIKEVLRGHTKWVYGVVFTPDNQHIISASHDTTARIWKLSKKKSNMFQKVDSQIFTVAFSPNGSQIATGSGNGKINLWNKNGEWIRGWQIANKTSVYTIAFSPNGNQIATGSSDSKVHLWDSKGKLIEVLNGHDDPVLSIAFSPDGKRIVTGSRDDNVHLWDKNANLLKKIKKHTDWVESVAFSPNGKQFVTGSRDGTARLWDKNGKLIKILEGHKDWIESVAFNRDGNYIATASRDGNIRLWNKNGKFIKALEVYQYGIKDIAFSPTNRELIAVAYYDGTVRFWDKDSNFLLQELVGHGDQVHSIAFSPDGKQIVTGSRDGTARLWSVVSLEQLIKDGCIWLQDYFVTNPEELQRLEACHKYLKTNVK
ncbi:WD40 repeat-containing protein [Rivularia sp. PCC 7116]|uniref:AAA-like domain-containing protein n=1 Tax=Rivularia sp. PCC 7116 TaxID=373994 RepID=UPI00029F199C|nr:AAA-like domain-containing protein [Rivularia sp. PCC 7116]AFY57241.1 WD40 repeat-containing protein [Rivularia sp. PCC 7116]